MSENAVGRELSGRVAVVTGGASGIGRATAILLAEHGAQVWVGDTELLDSNRETFQRLLIEQRTCDVRVEEDVRRLLVAAHSAGGRLDIWCTSQGVQSIAPPKL